MTHFKRTLVTAALPYANGPKHIGHIAGAYLPADIYTRFLRSIGREVIYVCGSDEHGTAIPIQAQKEGISPKEMIDKYHALLKANFEKLGIAFDIYHRTSEALHHATAQEIFLDMYKKGLFTEEESEQYYDEEHKTFLADRYIKGTCPNCANPNAYGDQCEKCGKSLSPSELINPVSTISGNQPVLKTTRHWYLPLQNQEPWLKEWLVEGHKNDWKPNVYGQSKSWIDGGLSPRAMTRDLDWGVKVPLENAKGKVLYVWFDAPIGYISATKALFSEIESGNIKYAYPENSQIKTAKAEDWKTWWQNDETRLLHFIGKDNIVFHCIIFPAMLHSTGDYIVPDNVPGNEFLNLEGDKMSTSRQWSVEMEDYFKNFDGKEDVLRYVLTAIAPETKDADFSWKDFQTRNNSELVAILGNFVNRVAVLTHKFYEGKVPAPSTLTEKDNELIAEYKRCTKAIEDNIENFKFREAQFEMMNMARAGNKYLADCEPWKTVKTDTERTDTVMYLALQITAGLAWWMAPFMPTTSQKLFAMLNLKSAEVKKDNFDQMPVGHVMNTPELLFTNIEDEIIQLQLDRLKSNRERMNAAENVLTTATEKTSEALKSEITFDDFSTMDLRVGTVLEAEKVPKADKLLKLKVDLGFEQRTIVSGIALDYSAESMVGRQIVVLANLAPRKIKNIESNGMLLMAKNADGSLKLISPAEGAENGSTVA
ncbi:MAG: methionine--tRNA ligase [Bacteroidota bacterium]